MYNKRQAVAYYTFVIKAKPGINITHFLLQ